MLLHLTIGFCCILLVKTLLLLCENIDFVEFYPIFLSKKLEYFFNKLVLNLAPLFTGSLITSCNFLQSFASNNF